MLLISPNHSLGYFGSKCGGSIPKGEIKGFAPESTSLLKYKCLATFFNTEISSLPDRFVMEIEENVNLRVGKERSSKIPLENRKNMQSQIVVCDSETVEKPRSYGFEYCNLLILLNADSARTAQLDFFDSLSRNQNFLLDLRVRS